MPTHTLVYIAGPLTHGGLGSYDANLAAAGTSAERLAREGYHVFCPHTAFAALRGYAEEAAVLELCLSVLRACDPDHTALCLLPGWETSFGSCAEAELARERGIIAVLLEDLL